MNISENVFYNCLGEQTSEPDLQVYDHQFQDYNTKEHKGYFMIRGLEAVIINHIMCRLNLSLVFRFCAHENLTKVNGMTISRFIIKREDLQMGSYITEGQNFVLVLLTTLRTSEDMTYFSFTRLMDGKSWFLLFLALVLTSKLWQTFTDSHISFTQAFVELFKILTMQTIIPMKNLNRIMKSNKYDRLGLAILFYIWILSSSFITKALSSVLLESYFQPRAFALIDTIDDLYSRKDIRIYNCYFLGAINETRPNIYDNLNKRCMDTERTLNWIKKKSLYKDNPDKLENYRIKKVLNGEAVELTYSEQARLLRWKYSGSSLVDAKEKYGLKFTAYFVREGIPFEGRLRYIFVISIECGLQSRERMINRINEQMKGRLFMAKEKDLIQENECTSSTCHEQINLARTFRTTISFLILGSLISVMVFLSEMYLMNKSSEMVEIKSIRGLTRFERTHPSTKLTRVIVESDRIVKNNHVEFIRSRPKVPGKYVY